jgi:hypothetical protein
VEARCGMWRDLAGSEEDFEIAGLVDVEPFGT